MTKTVLSQKYNELTSSLRGRKVKTTSIQKKQNKELSGLSVQLDKYYTKPAIAHICYQLFKEKTVQLGLSLEDTLFIEPSAGSGSFFNVIEFNKIGLDIAPAEEVIEAVQIHDFLLDELAQHKIKYIHSQTVFIGNPPFGVKSKLAIDFLNKGLEEGVAVGFVLPIQFRKWSVQSKINEGASLVLDYALPENAFTFLGKDYQLRCCFQIWCSKSLAHALPNLRLLIKPSIEHEDFILYQYNRTQAAEKFFDYDWDFAVPRQGYLDYTFKAFKKEDCNRKHQWIFFKAKNKKVLKKLLSLDFEKLSQNNTGTPGFGKADVVRAYNFIV